MTEQHRLGRPISVIRAELMEDEETRTIAETLGLPVEEYVEIVLAYLQDPKKEPQLELADEEELRESGAQVPSMQDMMAWLRKVDEGEIELGPHEVISGFDDDEETTQRKKALSVAGGGAVATAPRLGEEGRGQIQADESELGRSLKADLEKRAQAVRTASRAAAAIGEKPGPGKGAQPKGRKGR